MFFFEWPNTWKVCVFRVRGAYLAKRWDLDGLVSFPAAGNVVLDDQIDGSPSSWRAEWAANTRTHCQ